MVHRTVAIKSLYEIRRNRELEFYYSSAVTCSWSGVLAGGLPAVLAADWSDVRHCACAQVGEVCTQPQLKCKHKHWSRDSFTDAVVGVNE